MKEDKVCPYCGQNYVERKADKSRIKCECGHDKVDHMPSTRRCFFSTSCGCVEFKRRD